MSTAPPAPGERRPGDEEPLRAAAPPVVAVVVTRNPGPFLEEALRGLADQDYPALSVLVVDAGSEHDPTSRVGTALPTAFVRRLGGAPGFGGAANEALGAVQGATFFLVCHDDVVLDPSALRVLVEEAFRSNAAIVGPKLVDADDPSVLLDVGRAIDRLGGSHTGIEPGEVDQEQHDGVRDVFYISSAAMLVRADLFDELGGFDPETFPGSEDLDLCWRAQLAGARVMVAPDARARHYRASAARAKLDVPTERELARNRVTVLLTCYSLASLVWVVPLGIAASFVEAIAFSITRRRSEGVAKLVAWFWSLFHLGRIRRARRHAQALRRVHDRELHELQVGVGASFGAFLTQHRADERVESLGERGRDVLETLGETLRHPASWVLVGLVAFVLIGSRDLVSRGVPGVGDLVPWTGVRTLAAEMSSAWRHTGLGSTASAPPALGMMAILGTVLLGSVGLAQTFVVVGTLVVGPVVAFRLARTIGGSPGAGAATALVYGACAVPRNAVANGRLGPLVLYAVAPVVVLLLVRTGGFAGLAGRSRRPLLGLAIAVALATAWYPPALLLAPVAAVVLLLVSPIAGGATQSLRAIGAAVVACAGAALLLAPWTRTLADSTDDRASLGVAFHAHLDLSQVLRFQTGPNGAGIAAWGLLAAAGVAMVLADEARLAWVVRGWGLAIVGYGAVYLPGRLAPGAAVPAPEAALVVAALGLAMAAGVTIAMLGELLGGGRIGWRHAVGLLAGAGIVVGTFGFVADIVDGRWRASEGWHTALAFAQDRQFQGEFQILWLGDPAVLPVDPAPVDGSLSYVLTRNGPGDGRERLRAPETSADRVLARAVQVARRGETSRLGRMLAPAGVRYVAIALRNGPDGVRGRTPPDVARALDDQLDLARLGAPDGLLLYENQSWVPARAIVTGRRADAVPKDASDPLRAAAGVDLTGAHRFRADRASSGTILLAEAYDGGWSATSGGRTLTHARAFGLTNSWALPAPGAVTIQHDGQGAVVGLLALEAVLWLVAVVWWTRGRRRARTRERTVHRDRGTERAPRRDFIDEMAALDDDVDFWDRV